HSCTISTPNKKKALFLHILSFEFCFVFITLSARSSVLSEIHEVCRTFRNLSFWPSMFPAKLPIMGFGC
ncbi:hypothetical protein LINGRAHAP2_LOCUS8093, partial [Linum grandiflorum]